MNTQLIRLDAPYNLICGRENSYHSKFGLHIATLIVVSDRENIDSASNSSMIPVIHSYPIVNNDGKPDGEVWLETELKDCMVVGRQGATIGLYTYKRVMEFFHNHGETNLRAIPFFLVAYQTVYGLRFKFPGENGEGLLTKVGYVVNLEFNKTDDDVYIAFNDKKSEFFFFTSWLEHDNLNEERTREDAMNELAKLRDSYIVALGPKNIRTIIFTTNNKEFQSFVNQLNQIKIDEGMSACNRL